MWFGGSHHIFTEIGVVTQTTRFTTTGTALITMLRAKNGSSLSGKNLIHICGQKLHPSKPSIASMPFLLVGWLVPERLVTSADLNMNFASAAWGKLRQFHGAYPGNDLCFNGDTQQIVGRERRER